MIGAVVDVKASEEDMVHERKGRLLRYMMHQLMLTQQEYLIVQVNAYSLQDTVNVELLSVRQTEWHEW